MVTEEFRYCMCNGDKGQEASKKKKVPYQLLLCLNSNILTLLVNIGKLVHLQEHLHFPRFSSIARLRDRTTI